MTDLIYDLDAAPDNERDDTPHDYAAEALVLGAMLRDPQQLDPATRIVTANDFWRDGHRLIFNAAVGLYSRGQPVDATTVANRLGKDLARVGGYATLEQLTHNATAVVEVDYYAVIVRDQAQIRRLREHHQRGLQDLIIRGDATPLELYQRTTDHLATLPRSVPGIDDARPATSWAPVDLTDILDGTHVGPTATLLRRRDGKALLYPAAVHSISGEPGSGKTWLALIACAQELDAGNTVVFIDFEDRAETQACRLLSLGVPAEQIRAGFRYIRPDAPLDLAACSDLDQAISGATLAVIDGVTEAMTMHGLSLMDNTDVARWLALVPRRIADRGPAVLQVDHVVKNSDDRGRYAIGGQHKLAGVTGVAYKMVTVRSFGKGVKGQSKLVIDKDKHGDVGPNGATVADLHLDATDPTGVLHGWVDTPGQDTAEDGHFRPTTLMGRVSTQLKFAPGSTVNQIRSAVKGKSASIADAVQALILEGYVRTEDGPNRSVMHYLETPFEVES